MRFAEGQQHPHLLGGQCVQRGSREPNLFFLLDQTQTHQDPRRPGFGKEGGHYARRFPQKRTEVSMMSRQLCRGGVKDHGRACNTTSALSSSERQCENKGCSFGPKSPSKGRRLCWPK